MTIGQGREIKVKKCWKKRLDASKKNEILLNPINLERLTAKVSSSSSDLFYLQNCRPIMFLNWLRFWESQNTLLVLPFFPNWSFFSKLKIIVTLNALDQLLLTSISLILIEQKKEFWFEDRFYLKKKIWLSKFITFINVGREKFPKMACTQEIRPKSCY